LKIRERAADSWRAKEGEGWHENLTAIVPAGPVAAHATSFTLALTCEAKRAQADQVDERAS
jgi:hypothetical protein